MLDNREVLHIDVDLYELPEWMHTNGKIIREETISAAEYLIKHKLDTVNVIIILIHIGSSDIKMPLTLKLNIEELDDILPYLMQMALDNEEYEVCHRIQQITVSAEQLKMKHIDG